MHNFKVKRAHEAGDQFLLQNVQDEIFKIFKMLKTTWNSPDQSVELTQKLATRKTAPHLWYSYVVTNFDHYYALITEFF